MGKLTISIAPQHWLQLECFLFHHLWHLTGFMMILKQLFWRISEVIKKSRPHGEREPTIESIIISLSVVSSSIANTGDLRCCPSIFAPIIFPK